MSSLWTQIDVTSAERGKDTTKHNGQYTKAEVFYHLTAQLGRLAAFERDVDRNEVAPEHVLGWRLLLVAEVVTWFELLFDPLPREAVTAALEQFTATTAPVWIERHRSLPSHHWVIPSLLRAMKVLWR